MMSFDEMLFRDDISTTGHPARAAFLRGVAETAHELRQNVRDLAMAGSPASIAECQRLIMTQLSEIQS